MQPVLSKRYCLPNKLHIVTARITVTYTLNVKACKSHKVKQNAWDLFQMLSDV